jgi:hypothetical protein
MPPREALDRAWLNARFEHEHSPGWSPIEEDADTAQVFSRTGGPIALCWASADEVIAELGADRAVRTGYTCPAGSTAAIAEQADGHDLALVDGRFLVDGWLAHLIGETRCVLDLADPVDWAEAVRVHEPFATWTVPPAPQFQRAPVPTVRSRGPAPR